MNKIDEAFRAIPREQFLPEDVRDLAGLDRPLPIGYGQTNSQPMTVRLMLEWLGPGDGEKILDIGSGSGWTTALLAHLVGPKGQVHAVEKVKPLVSFGADNCRRLGITNATFHQAGEQLGLPEEAPFDRILVSASAAELPRELVDQLKTGGRLVLPVGEDILVINKNRGGDYEIEAHPGFLFVPLV